MNNEIEHILLSKKMNLSWTAVQAGGKFESCSEVVPAYRLIKLLLANHCAMFSYVLQLITELTYMIYIAFNLIKPEVLNANANGLNCLCNGDWFVFTL